MPSVPAHGASFRGAPVDFEVVVMHQNRRFRVASHQNAYIGALRRQVGCSPMRARASCRKLISMAMPDDCETASLPCCHFRSAGWLRRCRGSGCAFLTCCALR
jgi:hypothetical protein